MIFFIHIPKTAGTSLLECFKTIAGKSLLWYAPDPPDLTHELPKAPCDILAYPQIRELFKLYGGHFGLSQIAPYLREDDIVVSVVRAPVARAYSFYNHVTVNDLGHRLRPIVKDVGIIEATKRSSEFRNQIENMQCWHISGGHKEFDMARKVIEQDRVVVFDMKNAQSVVDLVAKSVGFENAPILPSLNESKNAGYLDEMTAEEIEFLAGINIEDQKLYDLVLERARAPAGV